MKSKRMDSFEARRELSAGGKTFEIASLRAVESATGAGLARLPFCMRVMLENLLRHEDGLSVRREDIEAVARWDQEALRGRVLESQQRRRLVYEASLQGATHSWDYQPYRDASRAYTRTHQDFGATEDAARWPPVSK